jgi:hypothetical protein
MTATATNTLHTPRQRGCKGQTRVALLGATSIRRSRPKKGRFPILRVGFRAWSEASRSFGLSPGQEFSSQSRIHPPHLCCPNPSVPVGVMNGILAFSSREAFMRSTKSAASSISCREGMSRGLPQKIGPRPALACWSVALGQMPNESNSKPQSMHFMALALISLCCVASIEPYE